MLRLPSYNRNSEFKFKYSYKHEQKCFQPIYYKSFVRISYDIRDGNVRKNQYVIHLCSLLRNVSMSLHTPRVILTTSLDDVMPYKTLGKLSDILHLNNRNNQLERRARPPRNIPLDA